MLILVRPPAIAPKLRKALPIRSNEVQDMNLVAIRLSILWMLAAPFVPVALLALLGHVLRRFEDAPGRAAAEMLQTPARL